MKEVLTMEFQNKVGMKEIYARYIRKNGKIIYPKNAKFFHFWVRDDGVYEQQTCEQLSLFDENMK